MEAKMISIKVADVIKQYPAGVCYEEIAKDFQKEFDSRIVLAIVNSKLNELHKKVYNDCEISFKTVKDRTGYKTYRRTASFVVIKAVYDVVGADKLTKIKTEFSIGRGLYFSIFGDVTVDDELVAKIKKRADEIITANLPIVKTSYNIDDAIALFHSNGMFDKERLFKYRRASRVNVYSLDGFCDYFYGYMCPSTGYIEHYNLYQYDKGIVMMMPERKTPDIVSEFVPSPKLYNTMMESTEWGNVFGIDTVGALNDKICHGGLEELILVSEASLQRQSTVWVVTEEMVMP